mgnify:CR=1 FL=1
MPKSKSRLARLSLTASIGDGTKQLILMRMNFEQINDIDIEVPSLKRRKNDENA